MMAEIKNINYIKQGEDVEKVVMEIEEQGEVKNAVVYLAFEDVRTQKRYMAYAMEDAVNNAEKEGKLTCSLGTFTLEDGSYVLESTDNESHNEVELPVINIIGLNNQKTTDEIWDMIKDKFGDKYIYVIDLDKMKQNVNSIKISETKPPRKVNIPYPIAQGIKLFYLASLNRILKEVYSAEAMSEEQMVAISDKLDKVEEKMDTLTDVYEEHQDKKGAQKSLEQIEQAKQDIEQAKNRLENMPILEDENIDYEDAIIAKTMELTQEQDAEMAAMDAVEGIDVALEETLEPVEESELEPSENVEMNEPETVEETNNPSEDVEVELTSEENIEPETKEENIEPSTEEQEAVTDEQQLMQAIHEVIESRSNELMASFTSINQKAIEDIRVIYETEMKRLMEQQAVQTSGLTDSLNKSTEKLSEYKSRLEAEERKTADLSAASQVLSADNEELQKKNSELTETIAAKDDQLSQQDRMIESFRGEIQSNKEASDAREQQLMSEIEQLKAEKAVLLQYKENYEKIASMFGGQPVTPQPVPSNQVSQAEIEQAVNEVMESNGIIPQEESSKTM